jgi:hypothetical protein
MVFLLAMKLTVGVLLNVYEAVDVLALIQDEAYENLRLMVKDALYLRSDNVLPYLTLLNLGF